MIGISLVDASARCGRSVLALRAAILRGDLPASRPPGTRAYVVAIDDLDRWAAPRVVSPSPKSKRESERARIERQLAAAGIGGAR
jgi:hypothetical protein